MKSKILFFIIVVFIVSSCGGSKKSMKKSAPPPAATQAPVTKPEPPKPEPVIEKPVIEEPIKEVVEKLIPIKETLPEPSQYFVIIGSFRNYDNALNYQRIISIDGFNSVLLRNEKGLYRVSVLGTNNINDARNEIRRIRNAFQKYNDTWLLIQEK